MNCMRERERCIIPMFSLSLSIIEISLLPCYWHQKDSIWRRTNGSTVNLNKVRFQNDNALISHNCRMDVISCSFMNQSHGVT